MRAKRHRLAALLRKVNRNSTISHTPYVHKQRSKADTPFGVTCARVFPPALPHTSFSSFLCTALALRLGVLYMDRSFWERAALLRSEQRTLPENQASQPLGITKSTTND